MPKKASKKPHSRKTSRKKGKSQKRSGKFIAVILVLLGFLCMAELVSFIINKAGSSKEFTVQDILEFSGEIQSCGAFNAWDVLALPSGFIVSDQGHKRLLMFDRQGQFVQEIGSKESGKPDFTEVSCLTS